MKNIICIIAIVLVSSFEVFSSDLKVPAIFSDNMVLQQKSLVPVWGKGAPNEKITVRTGWKQSASVTADSRGNWLAKVKTPKAGGPYTLTVTSSDTAITYKNVLIGEVWLCSGQSNMEMPLEGWPPKDTIYSAKAEIQGANYANIRFFSVARDYSDQVKDDVNGTWQECTPATAARFSATAFFFGKKLNRELNVPVGLINSSWGGTPVESWISSSQLKEVKEYEETLGLIAGSRDEFNRLQEWLAMHPVVNIAGKDLSQRWRGLELGDNDCASSGFDDSRWGEMKLPVVWETTELGNFDGAVWFRRQVHIPSGWVNRPLNLQIGPVDDMDEAFVNGVKVGETLDEGFWQTNRIYEVPASLVTDTVLTLAVRVTDNQGGGGIHGTTEKMQLTLKDQLSGAEEPAVSIEGAWKYLPVAVFRDMKFFVTGAANEEYFKRPRLTLDMSAYTPTVLYNAMIAPLVPYKIKGAIWYQGESNTNAPVMYEKLFPMMIKNWREDWSERFPFYYVQIAPYQYGQGTESQRLREAQFKTLSLPGVGMAVTMDIGNVNNIHPGNKKDVGERLALWALAKNYNRKNAYSGPVYRSMKILDNKIVLSFDNASKGLVLRPLNGRMNFEICGEDSVFRTADVKTEGNTLVVSSAGVKSPAAVRYAWSNTAEATLFNSDGLPASSFRTDDFEK